MKYLILFLIASAYNLAAFSQADPSNNININYRDYTLLKEFLLAQKNDPYLFDFKNKRGLKKNQPLFFFTEAKNYWNAELSDNFYGRLKIDRKKEFAPQLYFDNRFVAQSIPSGYGSQNYQWVPGTDTKYNFASDVVGSVIGSFLGIKPNTNRRDGYYTPTGIKY